uniref:Uncharacterized protein n=1 Tax=Oryza punctata TaxID=4537 RepID=A0A0E0KX63_ORYPU
MGDGDCRVVAPMSVRGVAMAVPAAVSEVPTEHFVRGTNAAMGVRSLACEATYYEGDLVGGALIPRPAVNHGGKLDPKAPPSFYPTTGPDTSGISSTVHPQPDANATAPALPSSPRKLVKLS